MRRGEVLGKREISLFFGLGEIRWALSRENMEGEKRSQKGTALWTDSPVIIGEGEGRGG